MPNRLIIAAAGAGKTYQIISESLEAVRAGKKVLVITYTEANQRELVSRFEEKEYALRANFVVKGWFSFLLEDFIRPYQTCLFPERIDSIRFNDSNPHRKGKYAIPGRAESLASGGVNPKHYLSDGATSVHTQFIAKLARKVSDQSENKAIKRLAEIYDHLYIDEVQDLIGWDYEVIDLVRQLSDLEVICVGDFRQTIYATAHATKKPTTSAEKLDKFISMGFEQQPNSCSRRSLQSICDFADQVHAGEGYEKTDSLVTQVPDEFNSHQGVFVVKHSDLDSYLEQFAPTVLRWSIPASNFIKNSNIDKVNFGKAKGLGFDRVLILPTNKILQYLKKDNKVFKQEKTEKSKNQLYVAITRARYSLALLVDDAEASKIGIDIWQG